MGAVWLVIGSSPSAPSSLAVALNAYTDPIVITTNAGLSLCRSCGVSPHFYWLSDRVACQRYGAEARRARQVGGAILMTAKRQESALRERGVLDFDAILEVVEPQQNLPICEKGKLISAGYSGLFCLQIAVNAGASKVVMIGLDGYRSVPGVPDSWTGQMGKASGALATAAWIGPFIQSVIDVHPETSFEMLGCPSYDLHGSNFRLFPLEALSC